MVHAEKVEITPRARFFQTLSVQCKHDNEWVLNSKHCTISLVLKLKHAETQRALLQSSLIKGRTAVGRVPRTPQSIGLCYFAKTPLLHLSH